MHSLTNLIICLYIKNIYLCCSLKGSFVMQRCILDIDVQGARSVRASSLEAIFIFICPPSPEELEKRLRARWA